MFSCILQFVYLKYFVSMGAILATLAERLDAADSG